jgi:hypothetical protein
MNDRDKFAAAALTGWLAASQQTVLSASAMASHAYEFADAMLAARGTTTDHDAAPAATASGRDSSAEAGTGDARAAQEPVAWALLDLKEFRHFYRALADARKVALKHGWAVVHLYAAPPAPGVTLTDAEREVLRVVRDDFADDGLDALAATLRGLLARTAKEGGR